MAGKPEEKKAASFLTNTANPPIEPCISREGMRKRNAGLQKPCSVTLTHSGHGLPELLSSDSSTRSQPLEPTSSGLLKGEHVSDREPWSKLWQGKHMLSDSLHHPSFTNYNKGFTISLQHKMDAERALKKLFHGNGHHSWR